MRKPQEASVGAVIRAVASPSPTVMLLQPLGRSTAGPIERVAAAVVSMVPLAVRMTRPVRPKSASALPISRVLHVISHRAVVGTG